MSKRVLITGGNKGIGLETTKEFLERGYEVIVVARDFSTFDNNKVRKVEFDLSEVENIPTLVAQIGEIDILVNNAGIANGIDYANYPREQIEYIVRVNLEAPFQLIKEYAKSFIVKGEGRIVNVASQAAQVGNPDIWYGITKAGVVNMTRSFANLLGPKGVVINGIAPGPVDTEMIKNSPYNKRFEEIKKRSYLERFATPEEVAKTIVWLGIDSPEYLNGEIININNGAQSIR
ncbi:SDR family NAD(P)-dependent oxidoreductase [Anaerosporobacter sp.]